MTNEQFPSRSLRGFAIEWARRIRPELERHEVRMPPELRRRNFLSDADYRACAEELRASGVPGVESNERVSADALSAVLLAICAFYGIEGHYAWTTQAVITERTRFSARTVRRAVARLRQVGVIVTQPVMDPKTGAQVCTYYFLPQHDPRSVPTPGPAHRRNRADASPDSEWLMY